MEFDIEKHKEHIKKRDALVAELLQLQREVDDINHQFEHGTFWYEEEVGRLHNSWVEKRKRIDEINRELDGE